MSTNDHVIVWEAPVIVPPEFRLYYDEHGKVVCYTTEKLEGNFIVIDALAFAEARPDVRVIDGKISKASQTSVISKLIPNKTQGQRTTTQDICIVVDESYQKETVNWKFTLHEL